MEYGSEGQGLAAFQPSTQTWRLISLSSYYYVVDMLEIEKTVQYQTYLINHRSGSTNDFLASRLYSNVRREWQWLNNPEWVLSALELPMIMEYVSWFKNREISCSSESEKYFSCVSNSSSSNVLRIKLQSNLFNTCVSSYILHNNYYRTLTKEGPWVVHLTLGHDWGMGRYSSMYHYHIHTWKSAQVSYPR